MPLACSLAKVRLLFIRDNMKMGAVDYQSAFIFCEVCHDSPSKNLSIYKYIYIYTLAIFGLLSLQENKICFWDMLTSGDMIFHARFDPLHQHF